MKNKLLLVLLLAPFSLFAVEEDSQLLSLNRCLEIAMQNHSDLQVLNEDEIIDYANYRIVNAQKKPSLSLGITTKEIKNDGLESGELPIPGRDTRYGVVAGLTATYDLYKPGRSESLRISKKNLEQSSIERIAKIENIRHKVKSSYYNYILAYESRRLQDLTFKRYSRIFRKITIESQAGIIGPVQLSDWQIKMSTAELDYEEAQQDLERSRTDLFLSMGLAEDVNANIEVVQMESVPDLIINEEQLIQIAQNNSSVILLNNIAVDVARNNYLISRSKRYPVFTLFSTLGYTNNEFLNTAMDPVDRVVESDNWEPSWTGGVRASMPIYTGGAIPANIQKAGSEYKKQLFSKNSAELDVRMSVRKIYRRLISLKKQIDISKAAVINAQTNLRIVERSYDSGLVEQGSISDASEDVYSVEIILLKNKIEYMTLLSELSNLVGIQEELICR
ncbi:MAG: TolC family protein [Spirochaetes bacterium]|jgi:outer membrane protein|nr:TolC family protein [Spirochaetota bacterium]